MSHRKTPDQREPPERPRPGKILIPLTILAILFLAAFIIGTHLH